MTFPVTSIVSKRSMNAMTQPQYEISSIFNSANINDYFMCTSANVCFRGTPRVSTFLSDGFKKIFENILRLSPIVKIVFPFAKGI